MLSQAALASSPLIAKHASFSAVRVHPAHIVLSCHIVFSEHVFFESKRCRYLMQALQSVELSPEHSEVGTCFGSSSTSLTCSSHFALKCQTADLSADAKDESEGDARTKVGLKLVHMCAFWCSLSSFVSQPNMQAERASSPLVAKHASFSAVRVRLQHIELYLY